MNGLAKMPMELQRHSMASLFAQLGEPHDSPAIERFIQARRPLAGNVQLHEAVFWSRTQAAFLREAISDDADWAGIADALNSELHAQH